MGILITDPRLQAASQVEVVRIMGDELKPGNRATIIMDESSFDIVPGARETFTDIVDRAVQHLLHVNSPPDKVVAKPDAVRHEEGIAYRVNAPEGDTPAQTEIMGPTEKPLQVYVSQLLSA